MPIDPQSRARLMDRMDARRLELRLTWRELCENAGVSYETLRNFRSGSGGMRELTRRRLSEALEWPSDEIGRILGDDDDGPGPDAPAIVRENWGDEHVRTIWTGLPPTVSESHRLVMITDYLDDRNAETDSEQSS